MTRDVERWWVLWKLRDTTERHIQSQSEETLSAGKSTFDRRKEFVEWLADSSMNDTFGGWIWRPFKLWSYRFRTFWEQDINKRKTLRSIKRKERIDLYNSIVNSCIFNNYIKVHKVNGFDHLHTTPLGDDYFSAYWYKRTLGHPITTAVIIAFIGGVLIFYTTERIKGLQPQEKQIYQIQILPYETQQR